MIANMTARESASKPISECKGRRSNCSFGNASYEDQEGKWCVLHYPGKEKSAEFTELLKEKINEEDFDFSGAWFPDKVDKFRLLKFSKDANFSNATFSEAASFRHAAFVAKADFSNTVFSAAASFGEATFGEKADFSKTVFSAPASFTEAKFSGIAYFRNAKFVAKADFGKSIFTADASFSEATFTAAATFSRAAFSEAANLRYATFSEAADFSKTTFVAGADFSEATFTAAADFSDASFGADAHFGKVTFSAVVDFGKARFNGDAYFRRTIFQARADFSRASFEESVSFFGETRERKQDGISIPKRALGMAPALDFQLANIEKPARFAFHTVELRPHWFVNVDPREFVLTDVRWNWKELTIEGEIDALKKAKKEKEEKQNEAPEADGVDDFNPLLQKACRQLAEHAEKNNSYEDASRFRSWAMNLARRDKWSGWAFWKTDWLHILYGLVSGYGERVFQAFLCLLGIWLVFGLLYTVGGFERPLGLTDALWHSFNVMALQKPEPKPVTTAARVLVGLETVFGPVQAALLALAIRRKFMR
jgi:uncharacterized protein YjbI with pentapeptide repeats